MKPFKPPSLVRKSTGNTAPPGPSIEPPLKKRCIDQDQDEDYAEVITSAANILKKPKSVQQTFQPPPRKPLHIVKNPGCSSECGVEGYYTVLWRKFTTKKNKTWDGDGVLSVSGGYVQLQDISGKSLGRAPYGGAILIGSEISVGGKEVEIESIISKEDFLSGKVFLGKVTKSTPTLKEIDQAKKVTLKAEAKHKKIAETQKDPLNPPISTTKASKSAFKAPLLNNTVQVHQRDSKVPIPRHDPSNENALVMKRPSSVPKGKKIVDVVVDPLLTQKLREHQRAGVAFLYECVMGMKDYGGEGAILADEMGLGKTLQTIALIWTLLKQNPIYEESPVIKKALIVCPVTLINNWRKEFRKWLGNERVGVFVAESNKTRLTDFTMGKSYSVMIIGYEKLRMVQADLQKGSGIDIVIADEGHRLKTAHNKSAMAIKSLNTERRIILSGTPLQNDLDEFYQMVDFVNPGLLNKQSVFKREFEIPILKSRQPGVSGKDLEKGEARSKELADLTAMFVLRRTADIISKYLPAKTEYVVFCKPTAAQAAVYRAVIGSPTFNAALGSPAISLELINILKKVCNNPSLLLKQVDKGGDNTITELLQSIPPSLLRSPAASGKLQVLDSLLHYIRTNTDDKVVLVSNYTSTMDVLVNLLNALSYKYLRLDGTTPPNKRQSLVDSFNRSARETSFVFLLSAKAGGVGLNLIGASRLILFDLDWNPATDLQAMARVHRDGQKKACFIYRLLTQGALDEKIFQRQVSKIGLADSVIDGRNGVSSFTREELRNLFSFDESHDCQTHKLLNCSCGGHGTPIAKPEEEQVQVEAHHNDGDESVIDGHDRTEVIRLIDEDEGLNFNRGQLQSAKQYDWKAEEAEIQREAKESRHPTNKAKMLSLMQYTHFDTSLIDHSFEEAKATSFDEIEDQISPSKADPLEGIIEDAALRSLLREEGRRIGFVFSKLST